MKNALAHLKTGRRNKEMKINWKQRFRNNKWLLTFVPVVAAVIYQILKVLGITPHVEHEQLIELAIMLVGILAVLGIVIDPTTPGVKDSTLVTSSAMSYGKYDKEIKINWKQRARNKVWLLSFITAVVAVIYQILKVLGITPSVAQDQIIETATMFVEILILMGVVIDPTTPGVKDSDLAMSYGKHDLEEIDSMGRGWDSSSKEVNDEQQQSSK
jgi:phi LC3 family holin